MDSTHGAYIVAWDFTNGEDNGILLVGKKENNKVEIVNAFTGKDADDIYNKLTTNNNA